MKKTEKENDSPGSSDLLKRVPISRKIIGI